MTEKSPSEQQFVPLHDAHAIEQVLIAVHMLRPIDAESFKKVRAIADQFSDDLPGTSEIQQIVMAFGQERGIANQQPKNGSLGLVLSRTAPNGVVETELRLEASSITFRTAKYTRWKTIWDQASRYLSAVIEIYAQENQISAISLNYIDKFLWAGDLIKCSPRLLLKPNSPYISPHIYGLEDLWHSHTGSFIRADSKTKRLLNVNVDYIHEEPINGERRLISISTVLTDMFNQPNYDSFEINPKDIPSFLGDKMKNLHDFSKIVFSDVISDEMAKRVALHSGKA